MPETDLKNIKKNFEKAKKGDKEFFSKIYEAYFKPLYRYVYLRIGNKAESDDLVQDIFIKALNSSEDSASYDSSPIIHFCNVARKSVLDWNRKRRRVLMPHENMENYPDEKASKTEENIKREDLYNLHNALADLSDDGQDAVIFKFMNGLSDEDIGSILGVSVPSARRLEAQGLILIRDILKRQYE